jgi:alkylation response protein AidB-like acyl-CoA dehydrogenase
MARYSRYARSMGVFPLEAGTDAVALLNAVRKFVDDEVLPNVAAWDRDDVLPDEVFNKLLELRLTGALVPATYGGPGLTASELFGIWRTLSQGWISLTGAVNPSGLATALLLRHGTEDQRSRWLPELASGRAVASFSITEPQAGSDLKQIETRARSLPGGGLEVTGRKRWIAGGVSSDVIFMLALVEGADRPSCVILPADGRGGPRWCVEELDKIGYRGVESAAYRFEGLWAPRAEVLGGPECIGKGARQMLDALDVGRINVACRALGIVDRVMHLAVAEASGREVGGGMLGEHTHTQLRIGQIRMRLLAAESLTMRAAAAVDARAADAKELATAAKVFASDLAVWSVDKAARLAASRSYAADNELARLRRDAPQTQIGEGANDALLFALARTALNT